MSSGGGLVGEDGERNTGAEAPRNCDLCPRLKAFRDACALAEPLWFNGAVPSFLPPGGSDSVRLLIVGLAPGLKGANRTGRPFTGDHAGLLLFETLLAHGFATGIYGARSDDRLTLQGCMITNAVRCVPPENKPTPAEIETCRPFLAARIKSMPRLEAIVALGRVAHESTLRALGLKLKDHPFAHGARHRLAPSLTMTDSFHCSRYNTSTGRLTSAMFHDVFASVRARLDLAS